MTRKQYSVDPINGLPPVSAALFGSRISSILMRS
jgi:hypothetical protein